MLIAERIGPLLFDSQNRPREYAAVRVGFRRVIQKLWIDIVRLEAYIKRVF
jgi:hypothetical protein